MRHLHGNIIFSGTDLMRFMGCAHATTLDLMCLPGEGPEPGEHSEDAALLKKQDYAHEAAHLEKLKSAGKAALKIPRGDLVADAQTTREVLAQGVEVVLQGALLWRVPQSVGQPEPDPSMKHVARIRAMAPGVEAIVRNRNGCMITPHFAALFESTRFPELPMRSQLARCHDR